MGRTEAAGIAMVGVWVGWTLFMWFAATRSFRTVDRVMGSSRTEFQQAVQPLGHDQARTVLRFLASEINRTFFRFYGWSQIVLGAALVLLLWRQTPRDLTALVVAGLMLGLVVVLTLFIQPEIVALGRAIDFVPRDPAPPSMSRFWTLHGAFTTLDGAKLLAGLVLLGRWIIRA
ncbi:MAG TPA: hypothetical protein VKU44_08255 [Terriglobia bacterium]|nr:hypothetical protein [Terriglobia bacterium]